jgi:triosephosphate isomerase
VKPLIVANWKCNPTTLKKAKLLLALLKRGAQGIRNVEVVICPPFIYLPILKAKGYNRLAFGSQDCFWEERGAFTGEVSPLMLNDLGVKYVIIGHSERRKYQRETNEIINKKLGAVLTVGLKPILCINKISQLPKNIRSSKLKIKSLILAYEPLFAIGTGKPCLPERAKKMRMMIKKEINVPVLYGGSVNSQNAQDYIDKAGFQGLLVGGASLKAKEFIKIIRNVSQP